MDNVSATLNVSIKIGNLDSLIIENIGLMNVVMVSGSIDTLLFHQVIMGNCSLSIDKVRSLLQIFNSDFSTSTTTVQFAKGSVHPTILWLILEM